MTILQTEYSTIKIASAEPQLALGEQIRILLSGQETDQQFSLVEITTPPGQGFRLLHTHLASETIQVMHGDYLIFGIDADGSKYSIPASEGAIVHIPAGTPHGYINIGHTPAKHLAIFSPAGNVEQFFKDVALPAGDHFPRPINKRPPDPAALMGVFQKHQFQVLEDF